ncbi:aspartate/glutamate racemase family protein [Acetomicrobium hydrogeniformans]|uniref:Asp/Glu/Hydantoin racemase n=1 Tax=Acetomicrobium hydrogeniformans ATCC BAA-1850 TaxID=592015 RepID=A0A0T5XA16_9BACT|nr:aspartate/glutamate racemase family protein [Acetomicrobium hydrogeniformans]KRT35223.1 Asp/Glu/Hydantoin racemase [Acetomicrobium hydrogeniformans ATCC BAA-1850]
MAKIKVGVIAGTSVDTAMGASVLEAHGYEALKCPISQRTEEQTILQVLHREQLTRITLEKIEWLKANGVDGILIYCNSLSTSVDLDWIREKSDIIIVTPLDVYKKIAKAYYKIGVLAANCQSAGGIEKIFYDNNPDILVVGAGMMPVVQAIEASMGPSNIVNSLGIKEIVRGMLAMGVETIVLGCTHFPYFVQELKSICDVPVYDPASEMINLLSLALNA